jgi:integrase/recombinase XerC
MRWCQNLARFRPNPQPDSSMKAAAADRVAQFRRYMTIERNLSAHTDSNYARDLAALIKFCDAHKLDDWSVIDSQHIRLFAAHSHSKGLAGRSIQRRLSAVRSFFEYLVKETHAQELARERPTDLINVKRNPAVDVRAPKARRRLPETLDADQMASLLKIPAGDHFVTRDRAIMELLYSSGLRLAELVGLDVSGLSLSDRTVTVLGKGRKERIVPVGTQATGARQTERNRPVCRAWRRAAGQARGPDQGGLLGASPGRDSAGVPPPVPAFICVAYP